VKFDPEIDYSVEGAGDNRYRLVPKGPLAQNQIYKVSIAEGPGDHDYSWAYQIKADFQVMESVPANHGHEVPVNTGIEINFNREGVENPEQFFGIEPAVKGSFEQHGTTLIFKPAQALAEGKVYTVTLKQGLKATATGETLAKDYVFSFETSRQNGPKDSGVYFTTDFADVYQKRPVFQASVNQSEKVKATIYKFDSGENFIASYRDSDNWQYDWSYYNAMRKPKSINGARKVLDYEMVFQGVQYQTYSEVPQDMDDGYYLLDATTGTQHSYVWFQKTPLAHYASFSYNRSLVWLYDFNKKKPLGDVSLQTTDGRVLGATDSEGLAQFNTPQEFRHQTDSSGYAGAAPNVTQVKAQGYQTYYVIQGNQNYYQNTIREGSLYWEHLTVDRPLYQPTDSIQFWGIAKPRDEIKTSGKVKVYLYRGWVFSPYSSSNVALPTDKQPVTSVEVPVSSMYTYEGKIDFAGLPADTYTIMAIADGKLVSQNTVNVTDYSKPSYQLSVTTDKKAYYTDQDIVYHVAAKFYDGTPLPNLTLKYAGYFDTNMEGTVTTNSAGEATFKIKLPYHQDTPENMAYWPRGFYVSLTPARAEEAFITATTNVTIIGPKVSLSLEDQPAQDGTNHYIVTARSLNTNLFEQNTDSYRDPVYQQAPPAVNQKVTVSVKKTTYTPRQTGEYYDYIEKVTRPTYTYDKADEIIETFSGTTDKGGQWEFDKKYPLEQNVSYSLLLEAADGDGKIARALGYYTSAGTSFYNGGNPDPYGLQPTLALSGGDNPHPVNIGDNFQMNVTFANQERASKSKPTKILYYAYQRDILKASSSDLLTFGDTFSQPMSPGIAYRAVVLGPVGFEETNSVFVSQDIKPQQLKVEVKTDKDQYRPGDTVNATVKATDASNKSASGTVHMYVVDQAVFDANGYEPDANTLVDLYKDVTETPAVSLTQYAGRNGDGGGGGGGAGTPRVKFQDTVLARSADLSGGEASFSFKLPDNLTSWRITTEAFDPKALKAGDSLSHISTSLPLFADVTLGQTYDKGDQPQFRVRVFGRDYDPSKPAHVTVTAPQINLKFEQDIKGNTAYVPAGKLPSGVYPVEVKVQQGNLSDDLQRNVTVLDSALSVPKTSASTLNGDTKNVPGNANGLTEVVVTDKGRGSQFRAASWLAWQSGTRFDQRAASFYAQTVLHDQFGMPGDVPHFDASIFQVKTDDNGDPVGMSLFPYSSSDLKVSALGTALIPENLPKSDMVFYFNKSLKDQKADTHRISQALLGLAAYNEPVLNKLQLFKDEPALDLEDKLFVANALGVMGDKENARKIYSEQIKPKLTADNGQLYIADPDETRQGKLTALAGMLAAQLNYPTDRDQIVEYLNSHEPKKDTAALEEAFIIKSALSYAPKENGKFSYKTSQRSGTVELKNGNRFNLELLSNELSSLEFSGVSGDLQLLTWYEGPADSSTQPTLNIPIQRTYSVNGKTTNTFKDGDLVKVSISVQPKTAVGISKVFTLTDITPAGLMPITPTYYFDIRNTYIPGNEDSCNPLFNYPDIVDGRKIKFTIGTSVSPKCPAASAMRVVYFARVVGVGAFHADPTVITSLESPADFGLGPAADIQINP
jgi:hypothetical protein